MPATREPIGGVFALEEPVRQADGETLLERWSKGAAAVHLFHNARSALSHILNSMQPSRLWLPAYLCPDTLQAVPDGLTLLYYPVGSALDPNFEVLESETRAGDAVLGIAYFGRPQPSVWRSMAQRRQDIFWIEDYAQALDTGGSPLSSLRIYSPRKLLGAPDGGILVDTDGKVPAPLLELPGDTKFIDPYRMRAADPAGQLNERWYAAFRSVEAAMAVSRQAISVESRRILERTAVDPIANARRGNYRTLLETLSSHALFGDLPIDWVPLGFPMRFEDADGLCAWLAEHRVFAPRHWRDLPSPESDFPEEHALSRSLLTLPCDQRYGEDDMRFMAELVERYIG